MFLQPWKHNENAGSLISTSVGQTGKPSFPINKRNNLLSGVPKITVLCI